MFCFITHRTSISSVNTLEKTTIFPDETTTEYIRYIESTSEKTTAEDVTTLVVGTSVKTNTGFTTLTTAETTSTSLPEHTSEGTTSVTEKTTVLTTAEIASTSLQDTSEGSTSITEITTIVTTSEVTSMLPEDTSERSTSVTDEGTITTTREIVSTLPENTSERSTSVTEETTIVTTAEVTPTLPEDTSERRTSVTEKTTVPTTAEIASTSLQDTSEESTSLTEETTIVTTSEITSTLPEYTSEQNTYVTDDGTIATTSYRTSIPAETITGLNTTIIDQATTEFSSESSITLTVTKPTQTSFYTDQTMFETVTDVISGASETISITIINVSNETTVEWSTGTALSTIFTEQERTTIFRDEVSIVTSSQSSLSLATMTGETTSLFTHETVTTTYPINNSESISTLTTAKETSTEIDGTTVILTGSDVSVNSTDTTTDSTDYFRGSTISIGETFGISLTTSLFTTEETSKVTSLNPTMTPIETNCFSSTISVTYNSTFCSNVSLIPWTDCNCTLRIVAQNAAVNRLRNATDLTATSVAQLLTIYYASMMDPMLSSNAGNILTPSEVENNVRRLDSNTTVVAEKSHLVAQFIDKSNNNSMLGASFQHNYQSQTISNSNEVNVINSNISAAAIFSHDSLNDTTMLKMLLINKPYDYQSSTDSPEKKIVSSVIVAEVERNNSLSKLMNISLYFQHENVPNVNIGNFSCAYYDTNSSTWSNTNCSSPTKNSILGRYECFCTYFSTPAMVLPSSSGKKRACSLIR
ncbi:unnamed protein product [Rotaria sp. Silwood1]|nr:unnamed protein product [Rotaria sp. Silwood1]